MLRFPSCKGMCPVDMQVKKVLVVGIPENNSVVSRTCVGLLSPARMGEKASRTQAEKLSAQAQY